ncbi:MAG TPA: halocarboxylic acid dehydrogenase DehI family protein [Terriglobales bacterium]
MPVKRQRRIALVPESAAQGRVLEIYQEIKAALGVPQVNILFQAYGAYPKFLELHWQAIKPTLGTAEFFQFADRLRAEAYTRAHNYFAVPDFCEEVKEMQLSQGARQELTEIVELFHYNNPLLLLIVAAQMHAFDEASVTQRQSSSPATHPVFAHKPCSVPEEHATERVKRVYEDIKRTLGLNFINSDYRALGRFPDFLEAYWEAMKPALALPIYSEHKRRLRESAFGFAAELPFAPQLSIQHMQDAGVEEEQITDIVRLTEQFIDLISGLVLNVCFAKIGLEGGTRGDHGKHEKKTVWEPIEQKADSTPDDTPKRAA